MKKIGLKINTTSGVVTNLSGTADESVSDLSVVHGDTVLFACHFVETLSSGSETDMDLSAATALRCVVEDARASNATELTVQTSYNQGYDASVTENLATGYVTWAVSFTGAAMDSEIGTSESISTWIEFTYLDSNPFPQTLNQSQLTIYAQLDDGAVGSPPPTSPTYFTATEVIAQTVAIRPTSHTPVDYTALGTTTVFTVPAGKEFYLDRCKQGTTAITTPGTAPTLRWLKDAAYLDPFAISGSNATGKFVSWEFDDILVAGEALKVEVVSVSTAATHTGKCFATGELIDA